MNKNIFLESPKNPEQHIDQIGSPVTWLEISGNLKSDLTTPKAWRTESVFQW